VVAEVPTPRRGPGQVLIKLTAAGMNPMDRTLASGDWRPMRATFPMVLGADGAGVIDTVGDGTARFSAGDHVFGQLLIAPLGSAGTYAEYVAVTEDAPLARVPDGLGLVVAAALPTRVPAEIPEQFTEPLGEIVSRLRTTDPTTAATVLDEARAIHDGALATITSAESRAVSLQSTVSIAATLVVAGGALLVDPTKIHDRSWRIVLLSALGIVLLCLIGCAWRALAVTGRMFQFEQPGPERIFLRARLTGPSAQTFRAAELLRAAGVATEIGAVKVGLLRSAAWWLWWALRMLVLFTVLLVLCVATESTGQAHASATAGSKTGAAGVTRGRSSRGAATDQRSGSTPAAAP